MRVIPSRHKLRSTKYGNKVMNGPVSNLKMAQQIASPRKVLSPMLMVFAFSVSTCCSLAAAPTSSTSPQLYLFSLKYIPESVAGSSFIQIDTSNERNNNTDFNEGSRDDSLSYYHESKPVRELWKWKDAVLGDGRDFFVPKPKTLSALQNYLLDHCPSLSRKENACVILSNCARFEILVACRTEKIMSHSTAAVKGDHGKNLSFQEQLAKEIALCLLAQSNFHAEKQHRSNGWKAFWMAAATPNNAADRPQDVLTRDAPTVSSRESDNGAAYAAPFPYWDVLAGAEEILPHLCRIAAGMAPRPRRPDRAVLFRPFSSRDAHILLQLKRTRELAIEKKSDAALVIKGDGDGPDERLRNRLALLLEYALRAGKAARNPTIVPELESLRAEYKASPSSSSSSISAKDLERSVRVAEIAYSRAVLPLVREYLQKEKISSLNVDQDIAHLRSTCLSMVRSHREDELRWMNRKLHGLTLELRNDGRLISYNSPEECFQTIQKDLEAFRCCSED